MNLFNKVAQLQKESQDALSIFEKTATKLQNINEAIIKAKAARAVKIEAKLKEVEALQGEMSSLVASADKNTRLSIKLMSFLED